MKPIAHIRTDLPQKFGIPRNSFLAPHLQGRIVFEPEFALPQAVEGLEEFSHLWLLWEFENGVPGGTAADIARDAAAHDARVRMPQATAVLNDGIRAGVTACDRRACSAAVALNDGACAGGPRVDDSCGWGLTPPATPPKDSHDAAASWTPTVRPPRLGGSERKGVFATRSPFRPNPIGLTCVKLDRIELVDGAPVIHVLAADLRDGTSIYDIKPYIPFADCHPEASGGWIDRAPWQELEVDFPEDLQACVPASKLAGLIEVLRQDPRRAGSKHEPERVYHLAYAGIDVSFTVDIDTLHVVETIPSA